jgi:hypothetical protein
MLSPVYTNGHNGCYHDCGQWHDVCFVRDHDKTHTDHEHGSRHSRMGQIRAHRQARAHLHRRRIHRPIRRVRYWRANDVLQGRSPNRLHGPCARVCRLRVADTIKKNLPTRIVLILAACPRPFGRGHRGGIEIMTAKQAKQTVMALEARPYRIAVFGTTTKVSGHGKRQRTTTIGYGFFAWTPEQHFSEARLPSAGSFLFPGLFTVRAAAMDYFNDPAVHQVQVRNNQDRKLYLWNRQHDGTIRGYRPAEAD